MLARFGYVIFYLLLALCFTSPPCLAVDWPPSDPKEYSTTTDFTLAWAMKLKGFHKLEDLQRAAKAKGTISERALDEADPHVSYHWRSEPKYKNNVGYMVATVRPSGTINVSIMTTGNQEVILDNAGTFIVGSLR